MQDDEALGSPLAEANRLQQRAAGVGFDWPDARGPLAKVKEETAELEREAGSPTGLPDGRGERETIEAELGDLLFAVVNTARKLDIDPDHALARANDKFRRRFAALQRLAHQRGLVMGRASLEQLDALWDEVKRGGKGREEGASYRPFFSRPQVLERARKRDRPPDVGNAPDPGHPSLDAQAEARVHDRALQSER